MNNLLDRFFNYVSFDTQSKSGVRQVPSTDGQMKLARALKAELVELGFEQVTLSDHGCVMATLPSNVSWKAPTIGFISHLDTALTPVAKMLIHKSLKTIAAEILRWALVTKCCRL